MSWIDVKLPVYPCHRKWDLNSGFDSTTVLGIWETSKKTWMDVASNQPTHKYTHNLRIFDTNRRVIHRIFLFISVCVWETKGRLYMIRIVDVLYVHRNFPTNYSICLKFQACTDKSIVWKHQGANKSRQQWNHHNFGWSPFQQQRKVKNE